MSVLRQRFSGNKTPPLQGRGKGWGLSPEQLAELHERARTMRLNPTEPEKRLWRNLSNSQLDGFKFRRQAVIGNHVADFLCPQKALVVEVDGHTHRPAADLNRDIALSDLGYRTLRVTNVDVMTNVDGVLSHLLATLRSLPDGWPHPNPAWQQVRPPDEPKACHAPEEEGLEGAKAKTPLSISLEGSVG